MFFQLLQRAHPAEMKEIVKANNKHRKKAAKGGKGGKGKGGAKSKGQASTPRVSATKHALEAAVATDHQQKRQKVEHGAAGASTAPPPPLQVAGQPQPQLSFFAAVTSGTK